MIHTATYHGVVVRRRRARAFFLPGTTQQVKSLPWSREMPWSREIGRAAAALACAATWASLFFVLAG